MRGKRWSGYLSWQRRRRHVHRADVLDALLASVRGERADQILLTGDLVHLGLPQEIEAAAAWLEALGPPEKVMLVPGNHDLYAVDSSPALAAHWAGYLPEHMVRNAAAMATGGGFPVVRQLAAGPDSVALIGVSSAQPSPLFMASGRLGAAQLARLEATLAGVSGFRCLLIHHPPLPGMTSWRKGLRDAAALAALLSRQPVDLALHGHVHHNVAATGPRQARVFGTASASSAAAHAPAAYRCFDVTATEGGWQVQMRLVTVDVTGRRVAREQERWTTPRRVSVAASGPSASR